MFDSDPAPGDGTDGPSFLSDMEDSEDLTLRHEIRLRTGLKRVVEKSGFPTTTTPTTAATTKTMELITSQS